MEKHYYIFAGKILTYGSAIEGSVEVTTDYDRQQSTHVSLTPEQVAFYEANKTATVREVWDCQLTAPVQLTKCRN
ncbi:MAG TPA: hypothetical protein VK152_06700 [Paludibacter sp.]|nr:hypothetical protein [Paludibacter sp.]